MTVSSAFTRRAALAAVILAFADPALASSAKKKEGKEGKEGEGSPPDPIVKMLPFAAPIVENGKLINYVFLTLNLKMAEGVPVAEMQGQEPILRDAIVRAAHLTPFNKSDSYNQVDEARLKAFVLSKAEALIGKGKVASVEITKQIARKQLPPPVPAKAASAAASVSEPVSGREIIP